MSSPTQAKSENFGIKTIHFPCDQITISELRRGNYQLSILQNYQGVVDIPLVPYYAQLDGIYPDSKFILTIRDENSWLQSVEDHWRLWRDKDPHRDFTDFTCACVYGTLDFNADRFRYVYETHVRNIRNYFCDRSDDLLILNIFEGEGWQELCHFLGLVVPAAQFPWVNDRRTNRDWIQKLEITIREISALVPPGSTFILVDDAKSGLELRVGRTAIPFLEREGSYYGPPPDSNTAIHEFERLRVNGSNFIVFAWPSFWWLDYYSEFHHHLLTRFHCTMANDRIVAFDLKSGPVSRS